MNDLKRIIIACLITPKTGYDISKELSDKTNHSHQQIYREIEKLRLDGLISIERVPQSDKPDRKVCTLTTLGKEQQTENENIAIQSDTFNRSNLLVSILSSNDDVMMVARLKEYKESQTLLSTQLVGSEEIHDVYRKLMIDAQLGFVEALITSLTKKD